MNTEYVMAQMWTYLCQMELYKLDLVLDALLKQKDWSSLSQEIKTLFLNSFNMAYDNVHGED